jgi:hypothetical protein
VACLIISNTMERDDFVDHSRPPQSFFFPFTGISILYLLPRFNSSSALQNKTVLILLILIRHSPLNDVRMSREEYFLK